jgi:undecaprenyl-diphosphatase
MLDLILTADVAATKIIHDVIPHIPLLDYFFTFLSAVGHTGIVWLVIMGILIYLEERRDKRFILYFFISFLVTAVFVNIILKNVFDRPRPPVVQTVKPVYTCPTDFSFPSGHASASFASAVILTAFDPKRKAYYLAAAFLISLSRIYLGCHFFIDVVTGGTIGVLISQLVLHIGHVQRAIPKRTKKGN